MATHKTDIETALTDPSDRYDGKLTRGRPQTTHSTWLNTGSLAQNDLIQVATLPVGAFVVPHLCQVSLSSSAGNASPSLDIEIGDAGDTDRYMKATDIKAGGTFIFAQDGLSAANRPAGCTPHFLRSGSNVVFAKITSASPVVNTTTGAPVEFSIAWVHGGGAVAE